MNLRFHPLPTCFVVSGALLILSACSKGERARKMEAELETVVSREVAVGASRTEVEAFIDRLVIDGEKPKRNPYQRDLSRLARLYPLARSAPTNKVCSFPQTDLEKSG